MLDELLEFPELLELLELEELFDPFVELDELPGALPEGGVPLGGVPVGGVPEGLVPEGGVPVGGVPLGGVPCCAFELELEEFVFVDAAFEFVFPLHPARRDPKSNIDAAMIAPFLSVR